MEADKRARSMDGGDLVEGKIGEGELACPCFPWKLMLWVTFCPPGDMLMPQVLVPGMYKDVRGSYWNRGPVLVSIHHQLGRPQNHLGDGSLGMPVRDLS